MVFFVSCYALFSAFDAQRVAAKIAGTLFYLQGDHLGSSSLVMTTGGTLNTRQTYYPYGAQRTTDGNPLPTDYTFTGQKNDDSTGLMFYGARHYDAMLGRFTQPDTIVPHPLNPQSLNRFSYTLNNPVRYIDPTGHVIEEGTGGGGGGGSDEPAEEDEPEEETACAENDTDCDGVADDEETDDTPADTGDDQEPDDDGLPTDEDGCASYAECQALADMVGWDAFHGHLKTYYQYRAIYYLNVESSGSVQDIEVSAAGVDTAWQRLLINGYLGQDVAQQTAFAATGGETNLLGLSVGLGTIGGVIGRAGKQARLLELLDDPNQPSHVRGWIRQELNSIDSGNRTTIRVPPGYNLAHQRGFEAKHGFDYEYSDLQGIDLHRLQHKYEGY